MNLTPLFGIWVDPETMTVRVADALENTEYGALNGKALALPEHPSQRPHLEHLRAHAQYHDWIATSLADDHQGNEGGR